MSNIFNYPDHALPPVLRDVASELHQHTQAPFPLIATSMLGTLSLAMQNQINMERLPGLVSPREPVPADGRGVGRAQNDRRSLAVPSLRRLRRGASRLVGA
jgi:hypothetical protein